VPTTFALIPGAGGSAWFWHRVVPHLTAAGADIEVMPGRHLMALSHPDELAARLLCSLSAS
jgi:hypothetical protein